MSILLDAVLAFFCCVGIWTLGQFIIKRVFGDLSEDFYACFSKEDQITWMSRKNTME